MDRDENKRNQVATAAAIALESNLVDFPLMRVRLGISDEEWTQLKAQTASSNVITANFN